MWGPQDGQTVAGTGSGIGFWGTHVSQSTDVQLQAFDPKAKTWSQIGTAHSGTSVFWRTKGGVDLFYWNDYRPIPLKYWEKGIFGHRARVRARSGDFQLLSTDDDSASCFISHGEDLVDFSNFCAAKESPTAHVYTKDYVGVDTGCTAEAKQLIAELNKYRAKSGKAAIPASPSLCAVGQAHVIDLAKNNPVTATCNLHSWSNQGSWSSCCYTDDHAQAGCMWNKPKELTTYTGTGYENAHAGGGSPFYIINTSWGSQSPAHRAVMLNQGQWANRTWRAVGAGMYQGYAVLWFGEQVDPAG
jgi:hypothetical protein